MIHSASWFLGVRKTIIYLPDQLIRITHRRCKHNDAKISKTRSVVNRLYIGRQHASIEDFTIITWYILREIKYSFHDNIEYIQPFHVALSSTKFTFPRESPFLDRSRRDIYHDVISHYDFMSISSQGVALTVLRTFFIVIL